MLEAIPFRRKLLKWFDQNGRKQLPWQVDKTPYRVWVSEIMLQQTQVQTVIPYYLRFMADFPHIEALASATEDQVLHRWTGLGYYQRARNLHQSAKIILQKYAGKFPENLDEIMALPGIGRSTAGAILAIAWQKKAPILDGNVKRVLVRLQGMKTWPGEKATNAKLWQLAEKLTPEKRSADYTQAMMDFGATICGRKPQCDRCPFRKNCRAHQLGIQANLPIAKPKKPLPVRHTHLLIIQQQHYVFLEKRPLKGIWSGLWSFPETKDLNMGALKDFCAQYFQRPIQSIEMGKIFRHTFTHFHWEIQPILIKIKKPAAKIMESDLHLWYDLHHPQAIGLPQPIKKILGML